MGFLVSLVSWDRRRLSHGMGIFVWKKNTREALSSFRCILSSYHQNHAKRSKLRSAHASPSTAYMLLLSNFGFDVFDAFFFFDGISDFDTSGYSDDS